MRSGKVRIFYTRRGEVGWGRLVLARLAAGAALFQLGCQAPAIVRTARTLPEGASDISASLNLTRLSLEETRVEGVSIPIRNFNLPNPLPDLLFNHGVTDDFELGVRLSLGSGLLEANAKYRFFQAPDAGVHLALAPAVGYRVLGLVNGPVLTLPFLATWELSPEWALSGGPLVSYASYRVPAGLSPDDADIGGNTLYAGGALGLEIRPGLGLHVLPSLEVQRSLARGGDLAQTPAIDLIFLGVTFGWASHAPAATHWRSEVR
jgi:hypothetical protein